MPTPIFNNDFSLLHIYEYLAIKQIIPQLAVKAFAVAIFPRAARFNVLRLHTETSTANASAPAR